MVDQASTAEGPAPGRRRRLRTVAFALGAFALLATGCRGSADVVTEEMEEEAVAVEFEVRDAPVGPIDRPFIEGEVERRGVEIVNTYDHDTALYTQGLEFVDGMLLESGGQWGESVLRIYDPITGEVVADRAVDDELFAEGATVHDGRVWQLTWLAEKALVYDLDGLEPVDEVAYRGEGWGLCELDGRFVMSDGSDRLTFRRTDDFVSLGSIAVTDQRVPLTDLNELECVTTMADGTATRRVWANVYQSNLIYGIDPDSGEVTDVVDASALVPPGFEGDLDRVLNGIAFNPDTGNFWLTGKYWPVLYEVRFG